MKRRRPPWQHMGNMLSLFAVLIMFVSGEIYEGEMGRRLQTVPPILQPIPPPNEEDVTPAPSIDCGTRCPSPPTNGGGQVPTFAPSQEDPPTAPTAAPTIGTIAPEPTRLPSFETPQPVDPQTPQPVEPQTPQPVELQTPQPVEPETPQPVETETPQPVETETPQPVEPETPQPVELQTPQPVEPETPQPVEPQTPQPVEPETPQPVEPQTPQPIEKPVPKPTPAPVVEATILPTLVPTSRLEPTTRAPIPNPTQFERTDPPASRTEQVPINDFVLTLGFDEPQTGTAQDLAVMTAEVNRILTETLTASLNEAITNEDVTLERIDLTVEPQLSQQRADNVFEGDRRLRALQQQTVNFLISGAARYSVASGSDITSNELEFDTNTAVATTMNDPQIQQALTEEFQNQTVSEPLRNTESVSAEVQAPASVDGNQKPTTVATIFGFILVGLGVIGLGMYGWAFFKKRRKRQRQRKRDRQRGLSGTLNTTHIANTTASMESMNSSINHSRSSPTSKMIVLPPADIENSSSEESDSSASASVYSDPATAPDCAPADSESSASDPYDGIASETSSKSDFTRELELAASLDKRSWIETQRQRGAADGSGAYIRYQSQYEVQGAEMQEGSGEGVITGAAVGIAAAGATAVGVAAVAAKSYPYGDEEESSDSDNVSIDLSEVKNPNVDELLGDAEEGVEWTPEGVWSPYDGYKAQAAEKSVSSLSDSRMADGRSGNQQDRGSWMKSWSSIDSFQGRLGRDKKDTNSNTKSWSSIDSARETQSRSMMLGSLAEDSEVEEELLVQEADRGIEVETVESRAPTISTAGTSNAVRMSPTASATEVIAAEKAKTEEEPDDEDSVLTQDIVKEVSRLARFVKKYDKKREKKLLKDREREEKTALAIKDSQSFPSVGYDAMSDSLSALRKGRVDASTSPRRERTTITNLVEETDESGESERSWSTTSNANRSFDDDDESSPDVDESEIDVSDDSNADEDHSEGASDASRLGITPYSIQRVVGKPQSLKPIKQLRGADSSAPETSRPPVTGKASDSRGLPPLANVADSPHEESPEKTHTPVQTVKRAMLRVSSARQKKFSQRTAQEQAQAPPRVSRSIGLTEDALHELSDGNGPAGVTSPHQKGTLSGLRKNEAILDTASSHFTDGVTSSQYEQAVKAGIFAQQEQQRAYLSRNSFKGTQRVPRDPPAPTSDSASIQATDEKRSPPGYEPKDTSIESRVQPAQSTPQEQTQAEERVPWSRPAPSEAPVDKTERAPSQPDTQRKAMFRPGGFKSTMGGTQNRDSSASQPTSSGLKRAAPEAAPLTPRTQETAPAPVSPAMRSPPRRKKRSSSAFNNVISMFESKPKNPIAPVGEHWQFNGATR